jgi:endonuclease YncB( thermonuclease family)
MSLHQPIVRRLPVSVCPRLVLAPCVALLLVVAAAVPLAVSAQESPQTRIYEARVTRVFDGDTVWVQPLTGGRYRKLRLDGLDAPEICQSGGMDSRDTLTRRVLRQSVTVTERQRDDYGRGLATLDHAGEDVGGWMVARGQAWSYRWRRSLGPYQAQEALARAHRLGLFAQADAEIPRTFRQRHGPCELPQGNTE